MFELKDRFKDMKKSEFEVDLYVWINEKIVKNERKIYENLLVM